MTEVAPLGTSGISDIQPQSKVQGTRIANPASAGFTMLEPGASLYKTSYGYLIVSPSGEQTALSPSRNVIRPPTELTNVRTTAVSEAEHKYGPGYSGYGGYYSPEAQRAGNLPPSAEVKPIVTDVARAVSSGAVSGYSIETGKGKEYFLTEKEAQTRINQITQAQEETLRAQGYYTKPPASPDIVKEFGTSGIQQWYKTESIKQISPEGTVFHPEMGFRPIGTYPAPTEQKIIPYTPSSIEKMFGFTQPPISSMQTDMFGTPRTRPGTPEITEPFYKTVKTISTLGLGFGFGGAFTTTSSLKGATFIQPGDFAAISRSFKLASSKAKSQFGEFLVSEEATIGKRTRLKPGEFKTPEKPPEPPKPEPSKESVAGVFGLDPGRYLKSATGGKGLTYKSPMERLTESWGQRSSELGQGTKEGQILIVKQGTKTTMKPQKVSEVTTNEEKPEVYFETIEEYRAKVEAEKPLSQYQIQLQKDVERLTGKSYESLRGVQLKQAIEKVKLEKTQVQTQAVTEKSLYNQMQSFQTKQISGLNLVSVETTKQVTGMKSLLLPVSTLKETTTQKQKQEQIYKNIGLQIPALIPISNEIPVFTNMQKYYETPTSLTPTTTIPDMPIFRPPEYPPEKPPTGFPPYSPPYIPGLKPPKIPLFKEERRRRKAKGKSKGGYFKTFRATPLIEPLAGLNKMFKAPAKKTYKKSKKGRR